MSCLFLTGGRNIPEDAFLDNFLGLHILPFFQFSEIVRQFHRKISIWIQHFKKIVLTYSASLRCCATNPVGRSELLIRTMRCRNSGWQLNRNSIVCVLYCFFTTWSPLTSLSVCRASPAVTLCPNFKLHWQFPLLIFGVGLFSSTQLTNENNNNNHG